ncbi:ADP-ribosylglycohydrolase family protein [Streptomyces sp. NPDC046862]|uniref:ADP-ribosylglycohydrolase family protein n=1 Tax=Streptomyces sp. NPDC046862 TaxID=3154603 RepID=UPI003455F51A
MYDTVPATNDTTPVTNGTTSRRYAEKVYAGVLGKIIGVYLGRPVEGWPYSAITERFGLVATYVNDALGIPLIVADDDISGTFAFARAVLDNPGRVPGPADVGDTWLNYIIEDRTILWWGGMGRSTEHTAFLNLRRGIPAPHSGSAELNGRTLSEQIGAQIFSDAFGLMCPGDPERATALTRAAASVSHDGDALESAGLLAALRALAFDESDLDVLLDTAAHVVTSPAVRALLDDVRAHCSTGQDWRAVRAWVDEHYGYARYPGPCHALSNLAMSLGALIAAGDDFPRSVAIASSVGFDTDSNAGTVGCLNGVRLGLDALATGPDLRTRVADRLLVVTAEGGECVSDATREADRIVSSASLLATGRPLPRRPRFAFAHRGSVQGFTACRYHAGRPILPNAQDIDVPDTVEVPQVTEVPEVRNDPSVPGGALLVRFGATAHVSTPTFLDPAETAGNFSTVASPSLYPGQTITARVSAVGHGIRVRPYALYATGENGSVTTRYGEESTPGPEPHTVRWQVPALGNHVPFRLGFSFSAPALAPGTGTGTDGDEQPAEARLHELDWDGAPERFEQQGLLLSSIWDTTPAALAPWVSSAKNFEADFTVTYSVSHPGPLGVVTTGTRDWTDYTIASRLTFSLHDAAGLVVRSRGHRRFHAGVFSGRDRLLLLRQHDGVRTVLAETPFQYRPDRPYDVELRCRGRELTLTVDGVARLTATTEDALGGAAGFLVEGGAVQADGALITRSAAP